MSKNRPDAGTFAIPIQRAIFGQSLPVRRPVGCRAAQNHSTQRKSPTLRQGL